MSTAAVLSATVRSDSPAKPSDAADVPLEDAHEKIVESEEPLPVGVTMIKKEPTEINNNTEGKSKQGETGDEQSLTNIEDATIKSEKAGDDQSLTNIEDAIKSEEAGEEKVGVLTEEMIKEEQHLEEEALKKEKQLEEDQEKLWKQMSDEDRDQRYQRLKFLLSKSNMYTQYLIDRMKRQTDEEAKKKDRQRKRIKRKVEKEKEKEQTEKEQKEKEQENENLETASQSSQASTTSTRSTRKRKSEVLSPGEPAKTPGKKARKKGGAKEDSDSQSNKENSQGDSNMEEAKGDNSETKMETEKEEDEAPYTAAEEEPQEEPEIQIPNRIINGEKVPDGQPMMFSGGVLRTYQVEGYSWLKVLFENGVNGILADEMGLGKTVQCVALIAHLASMGVSGPFLVVGPLSTVPNWYNEFRRFTPKVPVVLYHGSQLERQALRSKIRKKHTVRKNVEVQPVVITSYEIAMNDRKFLAGYEWKYLIVDEGHRLKNTHCRLIRELRMYHTTHRLLLTGTPLQNNLAELWSLLNFLLPEIFDDLGSFESWFHVENIRDASDDERIVKEEQRDNIISMLHQILTPFMLRRLKSDVDLFIPPKREVLVMAPLTQLQKEYYSSIVDKTILEKVGTRYDPPEADVVNSQGRPVRKTKKKKVDYSLMVEDPKDGEPKKSRKAKYEEDLEAWFKTIVDIQEENETPTAKKSRKSLINIKMQSSMMQLRKCCSHPYLLEHPIEEESGHLVGDETIVKHSGKMLMLDKLLPELKKRGHKVLVFCQMTTMMNILESYCHLRDYKYCRLDGSRSVVNRGEQIKSFNEDPNIFVFLVSTRAGGLGINLTGADTVIIYDSDWNPQSDLQAQDRCHRIGQTKPVLVYRFVTANTIDQKIVERAAAKRKLEKLIIHKEKFKTGMKEFSTSLKPISPEELLELLKSRDHEGVVQVNEKNIISNRDLENLLSRDDLYKKMAAMRGETKSESPKPKKGKAKSKKKEPVLEGKVFKVLDEETACYTNQAGETKATDTD